MLLVIIIQIFQIYFAISSKENELLLIRKKILWVANTQLPYIAEKEMFQQKLCQFSQMVSLIFLCLAILLAIAHSKQSLYKNDGGITYFDNSQNIKIKDRTMIRNNVYLIKIDCGNILVIGSESPWIEAILFEKGAKHITVLDYGKITSKHPNITILSPDKLREKYLEGIFRNEANEFDGMISFSSVEHSGLGR